MAEQQQQDVEQYAPRKIERDESDSENFEKVIENEEGSGKLTPLKMGAIFFLAMTYVGSHIPNFFNGTALVFIEKDVGIPANEISWVPLATSVGTACTAPLAGYIQDVLGRRGMLLVGMFLQIISGIIMGTTQSYAQIIAGATISGMASALQELTSMAAIAEFVPARKRGLFLALDTALSVLFVPSLLYGEELGTYASWRWMYWIAVIWNGVTVVGLFLTYMRLKLVNIRKSFTMSLIKEFDFVGAFLMIFGITLFLVALQSGGSKKPWTSAYVLVQLILGIILILCFAAWEIWGYGRSWNPKKFFSEGRKYNRPLIPTALFKGGRTVTLAYIICFMSGMQYHVALNLGPEIIQKGFRLSAIRSGVLGLGVALGFAVGATLCNLLLTAFNGRARELLVLATAIMTAFGGAASIITPFNSVEFSILGTFGAVGTGAALVPLTTILSLACPQQYIGTAIALATATRTIGGSVGYAIFYNILVTQAKDNLVTDVSQQLLSVGFPKKELFFFFATYAKDKAAVLSLPNVNGTVINAALLGTQYSITNAASNVYLGSIAVSGAAMIAAAFLPSVSEFMTDTVIQRTLD